MNRITKVFKDNFSKDMIAATLKYQQQYGFDAGKDGKTTWNNEADAFKHAYMQWELCYRFGPAMAKKLGDSHEFDRNNNPDGETNMDLWNNAIGREVYHEMVKRYGEDFKDWGKDWCSDVAAQIIYTKMRNGELITNPNDKRQYKNMELERLTENDRVYYKDEFQNFDERVKSLAAENYLTQAIDNNWQVPEKSNLDKRVRSGELIYVDDYTRADGTNVSGYYRRKPRY